MRIISGKYKGQSLHNFKARHIRPTTDRVKETLFNILQGRFIGAKVLDLFAGTGNLGIEALSRGASEVVFVENHPKSLEIIHQNLQKLRVTEPHRIYRLDALQYLKKPVDAGPFDLIFADPPFTEELADTVMKTAAKSPLFHENTLMAIESTRREKLESTYGDLRAKDQRHFGDKILTFFEKTH